MSKIFGQIGQEIGRECEERALSILLAKKMPSFVTGPPRMATPEEDAEKKDIVIPTVEGDIFLQVKRNPYRAALEQRHLPPGFVAVCVNENYSDGQIFGILMKAIVQAHKEVRG
jgi:hypothetical protein